MALLTNGGSTPNAPCPNCEGCCLISNDCLCRFTSLNKTIKLEDITDVVEDANDMLIACIGEECFKSICELVDTQGHISGIVRSNRTFQRLYAKWIELAWLEAYGSGKVSKEGIVFSEGDEESQFSVARYKDLYPKIQRVQVKIDRLENDFIEWFKKKNFDCYEEECVSTCGCNSSPCSCHHKTSPCNCGYKDCQCKNSSRPIYSSSLDDDDLIVGF